MYLGWRSLICSVSYAHGLSGGESVLKGIDIREHGSKIHYGATNVLRTLGEMACVGEYS